MNSLRSCLCVLTAMTGLVSNSATVRADDNLKSALQLETAHFHHVHLNVTNPERTLAFYEKFFGATRVDFRGKAKALFTEKSFILMNKVDATPPSNALTSLWHIGWAGVDGASEFQWRVAEGIEVHMPVNIPVLPGLDNKTSVMYFWGPERELIEVATGSRNHRFEHVHLLSTDIEATAAWFRDQLGLKPDFPKAIDFYGVLLNTVHVDNVNIVIFARPTPDLGNQFAAKELWPAGGFKGTDGAAIDHLAFSYRSIAPVLKRMKASGVRVERGISTDSRYGLSSFFVRGPDNLLVEVVEEKPIPEGIW